MWTKCPKTLRLIGTTELHAERAWSNHLLSPNNTQKSSSNDSSCKQKSTKQPQYSAHPFSYKFLSPLQNPFFPIPWTTQPQKPPHPPGNSPTERYGDDLEVSDLGDCCGRAPELMGLNSYEILLEIENWLPSQSLTWFTWKWHPGKGDSLFKTNHFQVPC